MNPLHPHPRKIHIVQGEQRLDDDPRTVFTTILGSCIAACIWDAEIGLGGMNHFLLPGDGAEPMRFGIHAMEHLVNALLRRGAAPERLQAKLFGGARMIRGLTDIGELNAQFATRFLAEIGIPLAGGSLGGSQGRRLQFWPATGRARQALLARPILRVKEFET